EVGNFLAGGGTELHQPFCFLARHSRTHPCVLGVPHLAHEIPAAGGKMRGVMQVVAMLEDRDRIALLDAVTDSVRPVARREDAADGRSLNLRDAVRQRHYFTKDAGANCWLSRPGCRE